MQNSDNIIQGSHLKKIVRHGLLYMVSSILVKAGHAILLPIYTYYLDPAEYAVFSNLMAIGAVAAVFISLYVDFAYVRLFFDTHDEPRKLKRLFSTLFFFSLSWGTIATVGAFFLVRNQTAQLLLVPWYPHILLACVIPLVTQMNALAAAHFRSQHRSGTVSGATLLGFISAAVVSVGLLSLTHIGPVSLLWGALAGACVIWLWYYGMLVREKVVGWCFSFPFLKEALVYSLGLLPLTASAWVSGQLDKLLITWFKALAESGVYSVAFELGRILNLFVMSLFMVYTPMMFAMLKEDARKNVGRIEQFQSFYFHIIIGMAFVISIFSPEIFHLFIAQKYYAGISLVPVIAFAFVFGGIRKLYATVIYYHKLTLLISLGGIMQAVISFGLNVLLIPHFGGFAAAWSKLISMILVAGYFYLLCAKYEPLRLNWRALATTLSILGACLALLGLCVYGLHLSFWPLAAAKGAIVILALALTWWSRFGAELRRVLTKKKVEQAPAVRQTSLPEDSMNQIDEV